MMGKATDLFYEARISMLRMCTFAIKLRSGERNCLCALHELGSVRHANLTMSSSRRRSLET